ncbi:MAG: hypothetical protein KBC81_03250 [Candidatus Pacebacteria bacterium]|nr:hypothetical protein [Candidatus Paceibacterota bacterium]
METSIFFKGQDQTLELYTRILCDIRPEQTEIIYIFGQTKDNESLVLDEVSELWNKMGVSTKIMIDQGTTNHGYPGYHTWLSALLKNGVPAENIIPLDIPADLNTLTESEALTDYMSQKKISSATIICPPFHQVRAFSTLVSSIIKKNLSIKIYNKPSDPKDWQANVFHSQGVLEASRKELIQEETKRIETYHKKGDILSVKEILEYLDSRK